MKYSFTVLLMLLSISRSISQIPEISQSAIGFLRINGHCMGTGFVAGMSNWVVTCAHVAEVPGKKQYQPGNDSIAYTLTLIKVLEPYDLAVYSSETPITEPLRVSKRFNVQPGDSITFVGWNAFISTSENPVIVVHNSQVQDIGLRFPVTRNYDFFDFKQQDIKGLNWKQVETIGVQGGYSGGVVFNSNLEVIGVMMEAHKASPIGRDIVSFWVKACSIEPFSRNIKKLSRIVRKND